MSPTPPSPPAPPTPPPPPPPPAHRLATDTEDGMLLVVSGPSGVGKTTVTRGIERSIPGAVFSISATTRERTPADVDGVDYHFVGEGEFERMRAAGEFLECAGVYGSKYGTPRAWVDEQLRRGRLVILEIDLQGAAQVKRKVPEAFAIFILPPSEEVLLERLRGRQREDEGTIRRRFATAKQEIEEARATGVYSEFLVNHRLDDTVRRACELILAERGRLRAARQSRGG